MRGSSRQIVMASIISCTVKGVKALCLCGRLMLILAMPSKKEKRISWYSLIGVQVTASATLFSTVAPFFVAI